jgi:hypothetical protein
MLGGQHPRLMKRHVRIFLEAAGAGPWLCTFCELEIDPDLPQTDIYGLNVHHLNEDRSDHRPANLAPSHRCCHSRHHTSKNNPAASEEARAKISAKLTGIKRSPETIERIRRARVEYWNRQRTG